VEVGIRVVGGGFCDRDRDGEVHVWAKGVEGEVERAIGKGVRFLCCLR
jgi:hypothetical protein